MLSLLISPLLSSLFFVLCMFMYVVSGIIRRRSVRKIELRIHIIDCIDKLNV